MDAALAPEKITSSWREYWLTRQRPNLYSVLYIAACFASWIVFWWVLYWLGAQQTTMTSQPPSFPWEVSQATMAFSVRVAWIAVQTFGLLVTFHLLFVCVPALRRRADPQLAAHFACVGNIVQTTYFGMLLSIALP